MLLLTVAALAGLASASITDNLGYNSPSYKVPSLATRRSEVVARHKRWAYYDGQVSFPYGIASGDPWPESVILWTHPVPAQNDPRPVCLEYQVSTSNSSWDNLVSSNQVWTTTDIDYSYKVEAGGLKPKSTYYYRFVNCADASNVSPVGRFKTIPEDTDDSFDKVSFAVYSCSRDEIDYAVHVGDYIYEYQGDGCADENACYGDGTEIDRVPLPNKEIFTLDEYRTRYKTYRSDPDLQLLHQTHAWQLIWDDHEVADNTWKAGSADSNDTLAGSYNGTSFTTRKANAVKTYFEWLPIRTVDTDDRLRIYRTFKFGTLADLILLDTRQYNRDVTDLYYNTVDVKAIRNDEARSLMGGLQENWLYGQMKNSSARGAQWKILGQQIVFANLNTENVDSWDGYTANRRRVLDTIEENKIDNVIIISGDSHANWVSDITYDNKTGYSSSTGQGSLAVEFAGTAVSSPSSFGYNHTTDAPFPKQYYQGVEQKLINGTGNDELQWTEGATRGYFELHLSRDSAIAKYYGIDDVRTRNTQETLLATFEVENKTNKLKRPVAGGSVAGGVLRV